MGRGDKRSGRGKVAAGSFGKTRNRKKIKARIKRTAERAKANKKSLSKKKK